MRAPEESVHAGLCHLCNMIPLWGLLYCGGVYFWMREESRYVVRNAREAMMFHCLLMLITLVFLVADILRRLMGVIIPPLGSLLWTVNMIIFAAVVVAYWATCLYGACRCFSNLQFHYPLIGRRRS